MKKKQAWKVMGAVLAGTLVFSDAVPLRASASAGTEKSAVQNETVSGTENGTETKTKRAAVYVNLKTGDDTADGTTAETRPLFHRAGGQSGSESSSPRRPHDESRSSDNW